MSSQKDNPFTLRDSENETSKEKKSRIDMHPFIKSIRSNTSYVEETRSYWDVPGAIPKFSLTAGSLSGPGMIVAPPLFFYKEDGRSMFLVIQFGGAVCGFRGVVHGGLLATILDEGLAACSMRNFPDKILVTASLKIKFIRPAPAEKLYVLKAEMVKSEGRKVWVEGKIGILGKEAEQIGNFDDRAVVAEAEGMYLVSVVKKIQRSMI
ncbi:hypothetical protein N7454_003832 [Penicillium verhagenii]|nr:hypothetical protein N7454_003832 [Penicillium verhagenii]